MALVGHNTEDTNQQLTNGKAAETSHKDLTSSKLGDQPPTENRPHKGCAVESDSHRERITRVETGLLEEIGRVVGKLQSAHDLRCPGKHRDFGPPEVGAPEAVEE